MTPHRVAVVGGGITGLTVAYLAEHRARARGLPLRVTMLESAPAVGGHVRTLREDGFIVEGGPNGFLDREPAMMALVGGLGLESRLVDAMAESRRRFILSRGTLFLVPEGPGTLLRFRALSARGRLRVMLEPFASGPPAGVEETVFDFAQRRIGREAADVLVDTAVSGISAGDSRLLSARAQFPLMIEMEREHGSLLRAMIARRRNGIGPPKLKSFDGGMGVLIERLAAELAGAVRVGAQVITIGREDAEWRLRIAAGETVAADEIILATSSSHAAGITAAMDAELADALLQIPSAPVAVAAFAFRKADVPRELDGYGYLVTRDEGLATLGVLWESSLFAGRAPDGMALFRVMLGGARNPQVASLRSESILDLGLGELRRTMGIAAAPARSWRFSGGAISQYSLGHMERVAAIRRLAARHPGLTLCGTSYDGVSFAAAVAGAAAAADALVARRAAA